MSTHSLNEIIDYSLNMVKSVTDSYGIGLEITVREVRECLLCKKEVSLDFSYVYFYKNKKDECFLCKDCFDGGESIKIMDDWILKNVYMKKKFIKDSYFITHWYKKDKNEWSPTKYLDQCRIFEKDIEITDAELFDKYFKLLSEVTYKTSRFNQNRRIFHLINASAKQKCLAFYLLFKGKVK